MVIVQVVCFRNQSMAVEAYMMLVQEHGGCDIQRTCSTTTRAWSEETQLDEEIAQRQRDLDQKDKKIEELEDNGASQGFTSSEADASCR
jgi:Skp family chaperone for outer membrane proteins